MSINDLIKFVNEYIMKHIRKRHLVYIVAIHGLLLAFLILTQIANESLIGIAGMLAILILLASLTDIGISIKDKRKRKKYIIYVSLFIIEIAAIASISIIKDIGLSNTWLGSIGISVILATMAVMFFDISKSMKYINNVIAHFFLIIGLVASGLAVLTIIVSFATY